MKSSSGGSFDRGANTPRVEAFIQALQTRHLVQIGVVGVAEMAR